MLTNIEIPEKKYCEDPDVHCTVESVSDWKTSLQYLKRGNRRFRENQPIARDLNSSEMKFMATWQYPFAVVLACSDSRTPPEIFFDQRPGDIFVIRNAGNIVDASVLGSIEFAIEVLKAPLVVVVGHSLCAAVINAFRGAEFSGNMKNLIDAIRPIVKGCQTEEEAIRKNADHVVCQIKNNDRVKKAGTKVVGAFYRIETGEVAFGE